MNARMLVTRPGRGIWHGGAVFLLTLFAAPCLLAQPSIPTNSPACLDYWSFSDTVTWTAAYGDAPLAFTNLSVSHLGDGTALVVDSPDPAYIEYPVYSDGAPNITIDTGSWMFWFMPTSWASANTNGSGLGVPGRLIELGSYTTNASVGWFSLYLDGTGTNIYFSAQTNNGTSANYRSANIAWTTNRWHFVVLTFCSTNTSLYIDSALAATGPGVTVMPPPDEVTNGFYLLSDATGEYQAHGALDDLLTFSNVVDTNTINSTFQSLQIYYWLDPMNPGNFGPDLSSASSSPAATPTFRAITGAGDLLAVATNAALCYDTNEWDVWLTNVSATVGTNVVPVLGSNGAVVYATNPLVAITFTICGGISNTAYDVFATPALTQPMSNGVWSWMGQGFPGVTYTLPGLTNSAVFLLLGTPYDPKNDGLTVAYERLISHSNPYDSDSINPAMLNGWAVLWEMDPFAIYDQAQFPNAPLARLGTGNLTTSPSPTKRDMGLSGLAD